MENFFCPCCRMIFDFENKVILDNNYTIWHEICFNGDYCGIKDKGSLINIIEKYKVFHEMLPKA